VKIYLAVLLLQLYASTLFDDEDSDMEGWDDDSDEGDNENDIASSTGSVNSVESAATIQDIDEDSFMEIGSSEDEGLIDTDDDNNDDNLFEEMDEKNKNLRLTKNEEKDDADDYEELIAKSWAERDALTKRDTKKRVGEVKKYSTKKRKYEGLKKDIAPCCLLRCFTTV
jgi:hypothetical protein